MSDDFFIGVHQFPCSLKQAEKKPANSMLLSLSHSSRAINVQVIDSLKLPSSHYRIVAVSLLCINHIDRFDKKDSKWILKKPQRRSSGYRRLGSVNSVRSMQRVGMRSATLMMKNERNARVKGSGLVVCSFFSCPTATSTLT